MYRFAFISSVLALMLRSSPLCNQIFTNYYSREHFVVIWIVKHFQLIFCVILCNFLPYDNFFMSVKRKCNSINSHLHVYLVLQILEGLLFVMNWCLTAAFLFYALRMMKIVKNLYFHKYAVLLCNKEINKLFAEIHLNNRKSPNL